MSVPILIESILRTKPRWSTRLPRMTLRRWRLSPRTIYSPYRALGVLLLFFLFLLSSLRSLPEFKQETPVGPLTKDIINSRKVIGGSWYIPPSWLDESDASTLRCSLKANSPILEAAECALELTLQHRAFLNNSRIPLIVHQTWKDLDLTAWPDVIKEPVEKWIRIAVQNHDEDLYGPQMAWFLWDDDGVDALIKKYEPTLYEDFKQLPYPVEKADVFRVVALKWFGGVYADMDTEPLKHPFEWILNSDLLPWSEWSSQRSHSLHKPTTQALLDDHPGVASDENVVIPGDENVPSEPSVHAIFGIEADNPPAPDTTYWRMGYTFAVQVTNWAFAMAPHHPVSDQFILSLKSAILQNRNRLREVDPLDITGPPALTASIMIIAKKEEPRLSWDALSGLNGDPKGGRGKIIAGDTLILPITGFSPGRGSFQNMGSQSITHENARLRHIAAGSWRKVNLKVHYGKLCRVLFGLCKDWKKIP